MRPPPPNREAYERLAEEIGHDVCRSDPVVNAFLMTVASGQFTPEEALCKIVRVLSQTQEKLMKELVTVACSRPFSVDLVDPDKGVFAVKPKAVGVVPPPETTS